MLTILQFDLKFTKGNTIVNFQKLNYLQKLYAQKFVAEGGTRFKTMVDQVMLVLEKYEKLHQMYVSSMHFIAQLINYSTIPGGKDRKEFVAAILRADAKQFTTPESFFERSKCFFESPLKQGTRYEPAAGHLVVEVITKRLFAIPEERWNENCLREACDASVQTIVESDETSTSWGDEPEKAIRGSLNHYLRGAIMASRPGPPMATTMEILGRDETLRRLEQGDNGALK